MDFLEEFVPNPELTITLEGHEVTVRRATLLKFFKLERILSKDEPTKVFDYLIEAANLNREFLEDQCSLGEVTQVFAQVVKFNQLHGRFPFMASSSKHDPLDYQGRELASVIHLIASSYGWPEEKILSLPPERAFFYALEIMVQQHHDREFQYALSSVGYDKQGRKNPYPKLMWRWHDQEVNSKIPKYLNISPEKAIEKGILPAGLVIDLSQGPVKAK